ncbi:hypothetical protein [Streptomyces sp. NPDC056255]|uniref:hypothetical protein n=1 Tax=Streptomyces sp. NPDC056255 TaxID=3345764 RepID=UPI0035E28307
MRDRAPAAVKNRHGRAHVVVRGGETTAPGRLFGSIHFPASGVNGHTFDRADTDTSCPEYKVTAVRVAAL